jgi:2-amino-4-hydroxy-6-hydroxymethyldihydropteridine diphosphokinase
LSKHIAYIGLGSNIRPRGLHILTALRSINELSGTRVTGLSNLYETAPVAVHTFNYFLNGVARVCTNLSARGLLTALQGIELRLGRDRTLVDRTIDLDLLLFDDLQISEEAMTIPHARMHLRLFVLKPLFELAPDLSIPGLEKTVRLLLQDLQGLKGQDQAIEPYHGEFLQEFCAFQKAIQAHYT